MSATDANSNDGVGYVRSPELLHVQETVVVVVDVQEKLLPLGIEPEELERNVCRIISGAAHAKVPVVSTEQYPKGLGSTVSSIADLLPTPSIDKLTFSCAGSDAFRKRLADLARRKVLLCGMETHVCVQQTAFDLLAAGYQVFLAVDAVAARSKTDHEIALRRMESSGVVLCTVESCLFEWCEQAGTDLFRSIRTLIV